jgi:peptidylprolyl isomerase
MLRRHRLLALGLVVVAVVSACSSSDDTEGAGGSEDSCQTGVDQEVTEGLTITEVECGEGDEAKAGDTVLVHYTGTLEDGTEFDSSEGGDPFSFTIGAGDVIEGWDQGIPGMKVGGKRTLTIAPELGYGDAGAGGVIPPGATLIFDVELVEITSQGSS